MKKFFSIFMVIVTLALSAITPVLAFSDDSIKLYRKNFTDKYVEPYDAADGYYFYFEEYYHYVDDMQEDIDWVLVYAGDMSYTDTKAKKLVGQRIFIEEKTSNPFPFKYAVYDVKEDEFYEIDESLLSKYDGLFDALRIAKAGIPLGDADSDKLLSITDATTIQRAIARIQDFAESDYLGDYEDMGGELMYISDFNRDNERSILDATTVQMFIANKGEDPTEPTEPDDMM